MTRVMVLMGKARETIGFIENEAMNTSGTGIVESFTANNTREFEITFKYYCLIILLLVMHWKT